MPAAEEAERRQAGLCADCVNAQKIRSDRGTKFILCRLSAKDPNFPKYPRLPVLKCAGFKPLPLPS
jgi:hypothetical protein